MLNKVQIIFTNNQEPKILDPYEDSEEILNYTLSDKFGLDYDIVPFKEGFVEIVEPAHSC